MKKIIITKRWHLRSAMIQYDINVRNAKEIMINQYGFANWYGDKK